MNTIERHIAEIEDGPVRLQEYAVGIFSKAYTKSALKKAIKQKLVFVNGKIASTAVFIKGGELIELRQPAENKKDTRLKLKLEVIYEDDYLAIINKPAGILVSGNGFKTVANALEQNLKQSTVADVVDPQPVHRLDYATTGLLLVGKTSSTIVSLNKLFEEKHIHKTYFAVTIGRMNSNGTIEFPIDNKKAISVYHVIESIPSERFGCLNLVRLTPFTGRRHQLRKHLLYIGNPILGDATYYLEGLLLKGKGMFLHAQSLEFTHPISGNVLHIRSELPKRFEKLFPRYDFYN
ncbi:RluA family pseudouridine synthase [Maribacter sp. X9]|uniref:RluA family pseudouridine synthase n=1 Tax=Maribacter sp. X9 TaxID=3402159 RepID=UPI003AF379B9